MSNLLNIAVADELLTFADTVAARLLTVDEVEHATVHTQTSTLAEALRGDSIDVAVVDWRLVASGEGRPLRTLVDEHPGVGFVVTGSTAAAVEVGQALRAGALAWVPKDAAFEELLTAVRAAAKHERWLPTRLVGSVLQELATDRPAVPNEGTLQSLTPREREVLQCMVDGLSREQIARSLRMSRNTVRTHVQNVLHKLQVHSTLRAVAVAHRAGLVARRAAVPEQRRAGSEPSALRPNGDA